MYSYVHDLSELAKDARNNPTKQEEKLWYQFLRTYRPKFQRQKPVLRFIADFYCAKAKLVIEIDGGYHSESNQKISDAERTSWIEQLGCKVIRFTNEEIDRQFPEVCEFIDSTVNERLAELSPDSPSPAESTMQNMKSAR